MDDAVPRSLIACCAILLSASLAAKPAQWADASEELLHSARMWESRDRGDLAQLALKKLVAARPDSPRVLLELGELDLRIRDFTDAAQVAEQFDHRFAGAPAARGFALEYRIATRERVQLAAIHRLIAINRTGEVRAALDRLFPEGAPADTLGIEYFELLACTPRGWAQASTGLARLAALHPDDPRYQFALARHFLERPQSAPAAVRILRGLAPRDDVPHAQVEQLLASARRDLRRPESTPTVGKEALRQAVLWADRSRASARRGLARQSAAEADAAAVLQRGQFESAIPVAQSLDSAGATAEAGELLALAAALAPHSDWLFETDMRWLIAHGQAEEAVPPLQGRTLKAPWTAARRDALLAAALDARANAEAALDSAAAIRDLKAAIRLAPGDPWMRFRLANLYTGRGAPDRGRAVMSDGARVAPADPVMAYAQALYLMSLEDYAGTLDIVDHVDARQRSADLNAIDDRARVALARTTARRLKRANDLEGARAALLAVDSIAGRSVERATELAYSWIEIGFAEHGIALLEPFYRASGSTDPHVLLTWARVLASAGDTVRLGAALDRLQTASALSVEERGEVASLQRALDLRIIRSWVHAGRFAEAAARLDELLAREPHDRALRAARADVYLADGQPRKARDLYASLAAEQPDDMQTRLDYIRALTESGDLGLARIQLQAIEDKVPSADDELQINLARRELGLGEAGAALRTLSRLLAASPRQDVLLLAARAALSERDFAAARDDFARAERAGGEETDAARRGLDDVDARLQSGVTAGLIVRHQPGNAGMSQLDLVTIPTAWLMPLDYERRLTARADAVTVDAGGSGANSSEAALLGTVQAAGTAGTRRYFNGEQSGMSVGAGYRTDRLSADVGTTPLGFLLTNVVGGVEWTPHWNSADVTLGVSRRAVTNSELSFAGLRDPISGTPWGAVVQTGPYAGLAMYRDRYSISGSVQVDDFTGTHVQSNEFVGARAAADWKFISRPDVSVVAGATLDYWNYQHNLSNYTFGSGGYYSPQSYVSFAAPVEINGMKAGWNYRMRVALSYTLRDTQTTAFYPGDGALQSAALHAPLPTGYSAPYFAADRSNSVGIYALAAGEREITRGLVVGGMLEIDRTDYYHPTTVSIYIRHAFGSQKTRAAYPVQPIRPYNP